jgi:branched-subunit amino acid transport protein
MSLGLIPLAILMWAVTFPARAMPMLAPGIDRLPPVAVAYLRLAGPTTLAALAAMNCLVTDATPPSLVVGIEPVAVIFCALIVAKTRLLLPGVVAAVLLVAVARALGAG